MGARSKARKRALDVLYAADLRGETPDAAYARAEGEGDSFGNDYTAVLVHGVSEHLARIDELLSTYSRDWTLERMPAVDRNVLRLGVWELLWSADVPSGVVLSEATALVRDLSTDDSPPFVNGLLGAIALHEARAV